MAMQVTWLGHSCFLVKASNGKRIVMDPYNQKVGMLPQELTADVVTVSHHHFDHDYIQAVKGRPVVVDKAGRHEFDGFRVTGIPSWHDDQMGAKRGPNMIFIVESEGIRLCHLGDLGVIPSKDELLRLEGIDMLLIPIGGTFTIDPKEADKLVSTIKPKIVMPMHYSMEPGFPALRPLSDFTDGKQGVVEHGAREYRLEKQRADGAYPVYLILSPVLGQ